MRRKNGHTVEMWKDCGFSGIEIDGEIRLYFNDADKSKPHFYGICYGPELKAIKDVFPKIKHLPKEVNFDPEAQYQVWSENENV